MEKMFYYERLRSVPAEAKKTIPAGRLKGMTDINPMWRIKRLTEEFGMCGVGWKVEVLKQWIEEGANGERAGFTNIHLYVKTEDGWSEPIFGNGGSMFISQERNGYYTDDEHFKKSMTDAIGQACKMLGIAADVYWDKDSTKYDSKSVAGSDGDASDETVLRASAEMNSCATYEAITACWNKYPQLQKNKVFIDACKAAQIKIKRPSV